MALMMFAVVASAEDDPITKYIASLPWHGSYATWPRDEDKPDFIIIISYAKKDVVSDKDVIPFKLYPDVKYRNEGRAAYKFRESFGRQSKWCSGYANIGAIRQDGFTVNLRLVLGGVNVSNETFHVIFDCPWKTQQEFTTNGFHIIVKTVKEIAEPTNTPYSQPAPQVEKRLFKPLPPR